MNSSASSEEAQKWAESFTALMASKRESIIPKIPAIEKLFLVSKCLWCNNNTVAASVL